VRQRGDAHHVVILGAAAGVQLVKLLLHAPASLGQRDDLADVLDDELVLLDVDDGLESGALLASLNLRCTRNWFKHYDPETPQK